MCIRDRILPNETYVKLMDEVEAVVTRAQDDKFDAETFLTYIPRTGPWEEIPASDHSKADARTRYIGPASAKLLNTNLVLGSSWIDSDRFKYERRITNLADYLKQKTIINANMWTPKQLFTPRRRSSSAQPVTKSAWAAPSSKATPATTTTCSLERLSLIHISSPRDRTRSRMPSSA